jgi:C_GCAxxG_C_C family probable redox protein
MLFMERMMRHGTDIWKEPTDWAESSKRTTTLIPLLDCDAKTNLRLRNRSLVNLSCMGHCAPTVMQSMLDVSETDAKWLVKLTAGLPGGIGNTGGECGGVTAPLVLLGLRHGLEAKGDLLPEIVYKGHDLLRRFAACHGTTLCRQIRGHARVPLRCVGVVRQAPGLCAQTMCSDCKGSISDDRKEAYARLYANWVEQGFHCAHAVFRRLGNAIPVTQDLLNGSSGFMGGTVFTGMTCSALTAGVMALGLALGEIENSRLRVLRMIATMAIGGAAFADKLNAFNKIMNLGALLSQWFAGEFGSTQCRAITHCDFSTPQGVRHYIESGGTLRCSAIAQSVAHKVQSIVTSRTAHPVA